MLTSSKIQLTIVFQNEKIISKNYFWKLFLTIISDNYFWKLFLKIILKIILKVIWKIIFKNNFEKLI